MTKNSNAYFGSKKCMNNGAEGQKSQYEFSLPDYLRLLDNPGKHNYYLKLSIANNFDVVRKKAIDER
jgi:hypothetical protein